MRHCIVVAGRLQHSKIRKRPVATVEDVQVLFTIASKIADEELVAGGHLPSWQVVIETVHQRERSTIRLQHSEVWECPVAAVEDEEVLFAVAIEIRDEELVVRGELPSWHRTVIAR